MSIRVSKVSVIIPVREVTAELREAIPYLLALRPKAEEIIVFPDEVVKESWEGVRFVATGSVPPAQKRNLALQYARGDVFAFIDDDAYPRPDWLKKALRHFNDPKVAAVVGPAVTPANDGWQAQLSGAVLTSKLGTGSAQMRYWPVGTVRDIDDWPSVNLIVRRDVFEKMGGFNANFWPGEDTKICLDIIKQGWRILYDPEVFVYHHRATTIMRHLQQVTRYGLHRGYYARKYPETSLRVVYFLPSVFMLGVLAGVVLFIGWPAGRYWLALVGAGVLLVSFIAGLVEARRMRNVLLVFGMPWLLLATHIVYGVAFLWGITALNLKRYQRSKR